MPTRRSEFLSPSWLIVGASLLFALMGACVKLASAQYGSGEIVMYRGVAGALIIGAVSRWRGDSLRTKVPAQHFLRGFTGVVALCLWFYALGELQLATAMTLNYTSSLWLALFLLGGIGLQRRRAGDRVLAGVAVVGFIGVVLVLRPTVDQGPARVRHRGSPVGNGLGHRLPAGRRARHGKESRRVGSSSTSRSPASSAGRLSARSRAGTATARAVSSGCSASAFCRPSPS